MIVAQSDVIVRPGPESPPDLATGTPMRDAPSYFPVGFGAHPVAIRSHEEAGIDLSSVRTHARTKEDFAAKEADE